MLFFEVEHLAVGVERLAVLLSSAGVQSKVRGRTRPYTCAPLQLDFGTGEAEARTASSEQRVTTTRTETFMAV